MKVVIAFICVVLLVYAIVANKKIPLFLVSLEKDVQRRKDFLKVSPTPDHIVGVDGFKLVVSELKSKGVVSHDSTLKRGEIGCYLSHVDLLRKACVQSEPVVIMEDDAKMTLSTVSRIHQVIKKAPKDWEIIFLGYNYFEPKNSSVNHDPHFTLVSKVHGTHAYIVNPSVRDKVDSLFPIRAPIDIFLSDAFVSYVVIPKQVLLSNVHAKTSNTQAFE